MSQRRLPGGKESGRFGGIEVFSWARIWSKHKILASLRGKSPLFPRNEAIKANILDI